MNKSNSKDRRLVHGEISYLIDIMNCRAIMEIEEVLPRKMCFDLLHTLSPRVYCGKNPKAFALAIIWLMDKRYTTVELSKWFGLDEVSICRHIDYIKGLKSFETFLETK